MAPDGIHRKARGRLFPEEFAAVKDTTIKGSWLEGERFLFGFVLVQKRRLE